MKKLSILFISMMLCISGYAQKRVSDKTISMQGKTGFLPSSAVTVVMRPNDALVIQFNERMEDVTVTVQETDGLLIQSQTLDVEINDSMTTLIPNYVEGNFSIEITTPEGSLEGNF